MPSYNGVACSYAGKDLAVSGIYTPVRIVALFHIPFMRSFYVGLAVVWTDKKPVFELLGKCVPSLLYSFLRMHYYKYKYSIVLDQIATLSVPYHYYHLYPITQSYTCTCNSFYSTRTCIRNSVCVLVHVLTVLVRLELLLTSVIVVGVHTRSSFI